jgi:iron complex transport system substrate-binding protein
MDGATQRLLAQGLSHERIDPEQLRALQPDLIIAQEQSAVSGVASTEVVTAVRQELGTHVEVYFLRPTLLQDIWDDIYCLGLATGQRQAAQALLEGLFTRVNTIVAESMLIQQPPRVAVLERLDPCTIAGQWMPELIQIAGGSAGFCQPGQPASVITWPALRDFAPEVLTVIPYGTPLASTLAALPTVQSLPGWEDLPAVRQGQVYAVDGQTYFDRPGPRIVDSLEILAGLMHPELFGDYLPTDAATYRRVG